MEVQRRFPAATREGGISVLGVTGARSPCGWACQRAGVLAFLSATADETEQEILFVLNTTIF